MLNIFHIGVLLWKRTDWHITNMYFNNYDLFIDPIEIKIDSNHIPTNLRNKYSILKIKKIFIERSNYEDKVNLLNILNEEYNSLFNTYE